MKKPTNEDVSVGQALAISRVDRWSIHRRLQELHIPCACLKDGSLRVDVNHALALILVRSTVQQFVASRQELVTWLDRCWHTEVTCKQNN
ncbi:MAG: hypothetical protein QNJ46_21130 [Leptolyngbyaceae cyanobacterium MO_188.B28]|nr:hypothetical protein [Leptolyngbyaceae cyanobacterium MO_188.B28]